jgi:hypothetical protein
MGGFKSVKYLMGIIFIENAYFAGMSFEHGVGTYFKGSGLLGVGVGRSSITLFESFLI